MKIHRYTYMYIEEILSYSNRKVCRTEACKLNLGKLNRHEWRRNCNQKSNEFINP